MERADESLLPGVYKEVGAALHADPTRLGLPYDSSTAAAHGLVFFVMGLFMSWNAAATNNPIFAEIVPESARTSIYALDSSFESILASFAPPVVGILAQKVYGYEPLRGSGQDRDRDWARMEALVEFELEQIEADLHAKEGSVIDIDYQTRGEFDDERRLLTPSR